MICDDTNGTDKNVVWDLDSDESENKNDEQPVGKKTKYADEKNSSDVIVVDKRFWAKNENKGPDKSERSEYPTFVEELKAEIEEEKNKVLKYAEALRKNKEENEKFRSRLNRDFNSKLERAKSDVFSDFLEVLDNFERAINAAGGSGDFESFHEGVKMIYHQFTGKLKDQGVRQIETVGKVFNPNEAEAIDVVEVADRTKHNFVVDELTKGYFFNEQVLRPARVRVCKCSEPEPEDEIDNSEKIDNTVENQD